MNIPDNNNWGPEIARVVAQLEASAAFLNSRHIEGLIEQTLARSAGRAQSPWLDRAGAAAHCACSTSEVDRVAALGVFKTYLRAGTPLFRREELDEVIASGRWPKRRAAAGGK